MASIDVVNQTARMYRCERCKAKGRSVMEETIRACPRCGGKLVEVVPEPSQAGTDTVGKGAGYSLITVNELAARLVPLLPKAKLLIEQASTDYPKPFDAAMVYALVLCGLCEGFGWKPGELVTMMLQMMPAAEDA